VTMPSPRPSGSVAFDNSGRVVLVSGGASGIGRAICEAFAASGGKVVCLDVDAAAAADLPRGIEFIPGDVSREEDCARAVAEAVSRHGGLDILVNNAAIQPPSSYVRVDELPVELWERMVGVNLSGYMFLAKHALRQMRRQQSGVVINLASGQGHRTARGVPAYGPIKAANILQAMQWGVEYARDGIRVVSVSPGAIDTPLVRATLEAQGGAAKLANRHPIGRLGRPEEVAAAVLWLASPGASLVTATDLSVDGGLAAFGAFAEPFPLPKAED
jgi:NAD(P)-dependent dehydrogenase (short-subunit alcohol dehydrogenase family)